MKVVGVIQDISSRTVSGNRTMYDIVVDGNKYGAGMYAPRGVAVGDTVEFEAEINGQYKNVGRGSLRKVYVAPGAALGSAQNAMVGPQVVASQRETAGFVGTPKPFVSDSDRQGIISRQAALNTGLTYVNILLENEAVPLPAKPADRLAFIQSLVFDATARFHKFSTGNDVEIPEDVGVVPQKKAAAKKTAAAESEEGGDEFQDDQVPIF